MAKLTKKQSKSYLLPAASYGASAGFLLTRSNRSGILNPRAFGVLGLVTSGACLLVYSTRKTNLFADIMVPKSFYGIKK